MSKIKGSCLCGAVTFEVTGPFDQFHLCHCSRCRKSSGSAHASNIFTKPDRITWLTGESLIKRFELPTAERFARCFCGQCGSGVPCLSRNGLALNIPAGSLDEDPVIRPQDNIFWRDRGCWYDEGLVAPRFDEYPE
ncbi:GFA family protein [Sedimenticola selenatireducens]|uniref:GFA family protein n=1 Tax=Sedimenticola selenatireducens TaxID=191960 RepID=A0A558DWJ2_9GAMM|nr:GFA family protein [Sedimenticola selenatireducens]TVO75491.1 GFA family protein [Sedimenticola selenatireducens]TVT65397.1 MAG: GFA family protein [Sedimenticola selenatireducens]